MRIIRSAIRKGFWKFYLNFLNSKNATCLKKKAGCIGMTSPMESLEAMNILLIYQVRVLLVICNYF